MANNTVLNTGSGGDTIRDIDKGGVKTQVVTLDMGGSGAETLLTGTVPVSGTVTANVGTTGGLALDATVSANQPRTVNLITGFALEAGHLATIDTSTAKIPSQGQAPMAASMPVAIASNQSAVPVSGTFWQATQPVSGTVTSNQGTANATPWNENLAQVGGSAVTLGQKASASSIPIVLASDGLGSSQATASYIQRRILTTYTAVYRLAARPYALSNAFGAAGRKQYATIHHAATAVKTVKLKRVEIALESSSAAGLVVADLVRITTAPATGNPAITPSPTNPANAAAESTCLALPTTAATEGALHSMIEWNMGITGSGSTVNPPPGLNWYTLWPQTQGASEADENQFPTIRPGILEGFAITLDASAALTAKGFVVIEFTEE